MDSMGDAYVKVKYVGESNPLALLNGKIYDARILKKGWYGIVDETEEEYAYPPELFVAVYGENDNLNRERIEEYMKLSSEELEKLIAEKEKEILKK